MNSPAFSVRRIGGNIGAQIEGFSLAGHHDDATIAQLREALVRHEVLVFRAQSISLEDQMRFAQRFGELSIHPFSPNLDDKREVIVLDNSAENPPALTDQWHSDETFREHPPMATILRARVVPEFGGDTLFASMTSAYRTLSERLKRAIHGLVALHDFKPWRGLFDGTPAHRAKLHELEMRYPNPWHPVVRVHPESGRRLINVNPQFTVRIRDLPVDEGDMLLRHLYSRAQIPELQCRIRWEPDTVVMWDNRSVHHYAPHDYYPQRRTMERVTIAGGPVHGVQGEYTPELGVEALPDGKGVRPTKTQTREFERSLART